MTNTIENIDLEDAINYKASSNNGDYEIEADAKLLSEDSCMVWMLDVKKQINKKKKCLSIKLSAPFISIKEKIKKQYERVFCLNGPYFDADKDFSHFLESVNQEIIKNCKKKLSIYEAGPLFSKAHDYFNRNLSKLEEN
jgi:hypothetical protein